MGMLVWIALDEFGPRLPRAQFYAVMLMLFESIAGSETLPPRLARQLLRTLWSRYQLAVRETRIH
jgi:hypothetical protein